MDVRISKSPHKTADRKYTIADSHLYISMIYGTYIWNVISLVKFANNARHWCTFIYIAL